jgi:hypothetical protein
MFQDVRANNQVIFAKGGDVIAIEVDPTKRGIGNLRQQTLLFVGESDWAATLDKLGPEDAVAAAEIQDASLRPERTANLLDPPHSILRLEKVEGRVVPVLEVLGYELVNDHLCAMLRTAQWDGKAIVAFASATFAGSTLPPWAGY